MPKYKVPVDKAGNFYLKHPYDVVEASLGGPDPDSKKVNLKLLKPTDAHIKVLTLTINHKTINTPVAGGKLLIIGPFPIHVGSNDISFEGTSDQAAVPLEIEMTPKYL